MNRRPVAFNEIILRPGDPLGARANIFTDSLEAKACLDELIAAKRPNIRFLIDATYADPHPYFYDPYVRLAKPTDGSKWNFEGVTLANQPFGNDVQWMGLTFEQDCQVENLRFIHGYRLVIYTDATSGASPFTAAGMGLEGQRIDWQVGPGAVPVFKLEQDGNFIAGGGDQIFGGFGGWDVGLPPIIDLNGHTLLLVGRLNIVDGSLGNSGGATTLTLRSLSAGDLSGYNGPNTWNNPALLNTTVVTQVLETVRHKVNTGGTLATGTYDAVLNELVMVDTTDNVTVNLPPAIMTGERVTVMDATGNAATKVITVAADGTDTVDGGASDTVDADGVARTYVVTAQGAWRAILPG